MSKERLLNALSESKSVESKNSFDDERLKKIRKNVNELRDQKKSLWHKNLKNLSVQKLEEIEKDLFELEKSLDLRSMETLIMMTLNTKE